MRISELKEKGESTLEAEIFSNIDVKVNNLVAHLITKITSLIDDMASKKIVDDLRNFLTVEAVGLLNQFDKHVVFQDYAYRALPMDNSADDILVPIMFTEIWVPLSYAAEVTSTLRTYFNEKPSERIKRTGNNSWSYMQQNHQKHG